MGCRNQRSSDHHLLHLPGAGDCRRPVCARFCVAQDCCAGVTPDTHLAALKTIRVEEGKRRMLSGVLRELVDTAKSLKNPVEEQPPQLTEVK